MPICFLLKNEIKWDSVNHRKWSGLLGKSNASCSATKVQTAHIILSLLQILPLCLITSILSFFKSFYFIPSNSLSLQWSVTERNQALNADSPITESRILPSVVVWFGTRHSVWFFAIPRTVAHQAPLSMGFPGQEYWSGLSFPTLENLPDSQIQTVALQSPALAGRFFFTTRATWEAQWNIT